MHDSGKIPDWASAAKAKRTAVNNLIPDEWQIASSPPSPEEQRDVTGEFVHQFLSERETQITETSATQIVRHLSKGQWKASEVTEAFCHRAAISHQLVSIFVLPAWESRQAQEGNADSLYIRLTASTRSSSRPRALMLNDWTSIMRNTESQSAHYTGYLSA